MVLKSIAEKYDASVSDVAARWVLDQPETGVVIIGEPKIPSQLLTDQIDAIARLETRYLVPPRVQPQD